MNRSAARTEGIKRSFSQLGQSRLPWWVVYLLVIVQAVVFLGGGIERMAGWYETFGLTRDAVFSGKIWQVVTYGLLHGGWIHLLVNALCVFLLGSKVEHIIGSKGLAKLLLGGVLGGGLGHLALAPGGPEAPLLVGFSGAAVALLIWITTLSPESRMWPLPLSGRSLGLGILVGEWLLAMMHPELDVPGFALVGNWLVNHGMEAWFQIGHACHFGGGMAGWIMAQWLLRPRTTLKSLRRERARQEAEDRKY